MPYGVKIEWIKGEEEEPRLGYHLNQNKNFIKGLMQYLEKGFLPDSKPYIRNSIFEACKLRIGAEIAKARGRDTFRYYMNEEFRPRYEENQEIQKYCDMLGSIQDKGLFTSALLREYAQIGERIIERLPKKEIFQETGEVVKFLKNIAEKKNTKKSMEENLLFIGWGK